MPGFGELWGHTGFIKSFMLYWPQENATICGTLNQANAQGTFPNSDRLRASSRLRSKCCAKDGPPAHSLAASVQIESLSAITGRIRLL